MSRGPTTTSGAPAVGTPAGGRLGGAVAVSFAGKSVELVTLVLLATVVPRVLGPERYGHFAVPLTLVTLGSLALTLGGPTLMARYVPAAPPGERAALARALGAHLARGRAVQLAGLVAAGAGAALAAPGRFPPLDVALVLAALALNVGAILALQTALGLGRTAAWSLRYGVHNAALVAAVLVLEPLLGPRGGLLAIVGAAAVMAAMGAATVWPLVRGGAPLVGVPQGARRFGALHAGGAALLQVVHRGGVVAVAVLAGGAAQSGYAALAVGLALGATSAVLQAFTVSLAHVAGGEGAMAPDGVATTPAHGAPPAEATLRRLAGGLLAVVVPGAVLAALLLDPAVPVLFGAGYRQAAPAMVPALAAVVLAPLNSLTVQVAALRLRPGVAVAGGAAGLVAFLAVAVATVPSWGAAGGTAAMFAGTAAAAAVATRLLPGAAGTRVTVATALGAAAVLLAAPGWWNPPA